MFLSAGLVLTGCGDDDTATTPAPAPPPPPPAPAPEPMAPATPTGLHVDETTASSITWHWNPVEGALGYVVQANMDGEWDETDTVLFDGVPFTTEDHYTATDLEPETMVYLRVAAAAGTPDAPLVSDFSEAVSGTSAMPPPVPTPFMVQFMIPDGEFPMVPDEGPGQGNEATATATVNQDMGVAVNMPAIITATFVPGASPIGLIPGENMPFQYTTWQALQGMVVTTGVTFAVQHVEIGANQVSLPIGDAVLVTCGPFQCMEGLAPPPISIADSSVCAGWMPEATLHLGLIDNDVFFTAGGTDDTGDDGVDAGWVTTSTAAMTVSHMFEGVDDGQNYSVSGPDAAKGTGKNLKMDRVDPDDTDTNDANNAYGDGIQINVNDAEPGSETNVSACIAEGTYDDTIGSNHRPQNCFRISAAGGVNYLDGYGLEFEAKDSEVSWGEVGWEQFDDLECDPMTVMAMDSVETSVCDLFAAEVDQALDGGWGGSKGTVTVAIGADGEDAQGGNAITGKVRMWTVGVPGASADRFSTLWFDDDIDGKIRKTGDILPGMGGPNDLYDQNGDTANIEVVWELLHDDDNDPSRGDFGKIDVGTFGNSNTDDDDEPDGKADNYGDDDDAQACSDADGDGCDAVWSESYEILFKDGIFGCSEERELTISCKWDAAGELGRYRADDHTDQPAFQAGGSFALTADGATGARVAGHIGAFAQCVAK
ncbi:MAG: fibronectin type III domain-containing protein [Synechococcus sp. SB0662_bin_14]|nr:fibronectin type III domain-containing protein [Synechococcus sp. SB0662_bin_14]